MARSTKPGPFIFWTTITYRSIAIAAVMVVLLIALIVNFAFPSATQAGMQLAGNLLDRVTKDEGHLSARGAVGNQQAHFTNIDGKVRVKKANSNTWVTADYSLPLEKGDVVQTSSEGMAKVVFSDGTNYTIKQDSLIVVEENSTNASAQTNVAVQVTTGTVDLATATYQQGSKSSVIVSGATANLAPESAAMVHNDPQSDRHEILLKRGSGEVQRGNEVVRLTDYEKVTFKNTSPQMAKIKEIIPPTLIAPANMMPIFLAAGQAKTVTFSWTPVDGATSYHVRVSHNPYFSSTVFDRVVHGTEVQIGGLNQGSYYWVVQSMQGDEKESVESEKNRFSMVPKGAEQAVIALELQPFVQHGHVIEVRGKTEAQARVMVNGEEVPVVAGDGQFHYFTPPFPNGESVITVTAQNAHGGVNTQQKKVVIQ
ncbi:MAG: hypothetical protein JOY79_01940 [Acidobacteriaceae bacterium]|nr:hypothetical protein [Acidobacteriaceae bacterium]